MKALLVEQIRDAYLDAEKSGKWVDYQAQRRLSSRIDDKEVNVSDIDAFYDYLVEMSNESNNKTKE